MKSICATLLSMITLIYIAFAALPSPVSACSCTEPPPAQTAYKTNDAVFSGKIVKIEKEDSSGGLQSSLDPVKVLVEVDETWKNASESQQIVATAESSASCGFPFEEGEEYLIYANEHDGELKTDLCSRTTSLDSAEGDMRILGDGERPDEEVNLEDSLGPSRFPYVIGGIVILVLGLFIYKRKRRARSTR
ncbi:hypothetical protein [Thalassobacillus sp. CUG 92003]|uniref:hypothetical protein n=1 Tax=Thalassobacillus sp. CUG 92003 TaxID=2736641 RepID=UPI0015E798F5|nr:hypothetical protein [Thalassobacillus sp. CUG 92003]